MTPELRITVLMENTAREGLEAEHGLSFFLEYRGRRFLLDAGSSGRFADNAQKAGGGLGWGRTGGSVPRTLRPCRRPAGLFCPQ